MYASLPFKKCRLIIAVFWRASLKFCLFIAKKKRKIEHTYAIKKSCQSQDFKRKHSTIQQKLFSYLLKKVPYIKSKSPTALSETLRTGT